MKFSNVRLLVKDYEKCFKFYTEHVVEFLKRHPYNQLNDTLSPTEEEKHSMETQKK